MDAIWAAAIFTPIFVGRFCETESHEDGVASPKDLGHDEACPSGKCQS
jgi:hypothetical protein